MNRVQRVRLAMAATAVGIGLMSVTGCGYINPQQTDQQYSPSDGVRADLGSLQLRNILIVSTGAAKPGRVIGAVFNQSANDATLTISGSDGAQTSIPVKGNSETYLNQSTNPAILSTSGGAPGTLVSVTIKSGTDSSTLQVPVLDGSLKEYQAYIPTPSATPSPSVSDSASPSGSASTGVSMSPSTGATASPTATGH
ncbi:MULTISPECIES: hypothetical protein [Arthrobacter]|uniref:Lipoprotein n=1 Tax=Arthrobacter terricola TaxID=2547396 RepID=A0A4R5K8B0_9MICC|nr:MULTISPECIES: hypothetical protein [Arthrobacter]MBT8163113.1 hypothetical protein [Arthrobacter sp. GN70]TDF87917.1 hypothetical protein E1809_24300 [Arthrobacter terricola]